MRRLIVLVAGLTTALGLWLVLTGGEAARPDLDAVPTSPGGGSSTVAISPVRIVISEADATVDYTVGNPTGTARTYLISSAELDADGTPFADSARSAGRWAATGPRSVTVAPGESVGVTVRVRPPADRGASERRIGVSFTEAPTDDSGSVSMASRITTSIYVEGTGPAVREIALTDLELPRFASRDLPISATLANRGTVVVVPGSAPSAIVGTMSDTASFALSGDVARPGEAVRVTGTVARAPLACWCQVRVTATSGDGQVSAVTGHVLVLPWRWVGAITGAVTLAALGLLLSRRRRHDAPPRA